MAHLLLLEVAGGNDFDLFEAALEQGHRVTFFTAQRSHYERNGTLQRHLARAERVVEVEPFDYAAFERAALDIDADDPFDAILCLIDIRMPEAAALARRLGLRFLNPDTARAMRDKFTVRAMLAARGIDQPEFMLALDNAQLRRAVDAMGLPVLVKPCDGYGSQNIVSFLGPDDLNALLDPLDDYLPCRTDYGFGVKANDRLLVERHITGQLIGCDTLTRDGRHMMLGINEKQMYAPPSAAIRGGCFPSDRYALAPIEAYVFAILDALGFNDGMAHTEILLSPRGPLLVEVNPRLVGAQIPRLLNLALGRSVHVDLINLHLGRDLPAPGELGACGFAVSRWIASATGGTLEALRLPQSTDPGIRHVEIFKKIGDTVSYPYQNGDRIGYVMTLGDTQERAEQLADAYVAAVQVIVSSGVKPAAAGGPGGA